MSQNHGSHNIFGEPLTEPVRKHRRVFISHRRFDTAVARKIAGYFDFLGLHYYLDEEDEVLQQTLARGHSTDRALVESIDQGLAHSTHLLAILSDRTMGSWWVSYEVGSARARGFASRTSAAHDSPRHGAGVPPIYDQLWTLEDLLSWLGVWSPARTRS